MAITKLQQNQIVPITTSTTTNLTGFIKGNGSVCSADNSTYITASSTESLTNKTLTSPKINEDVVLTATATQLNNLNLGSNDGWISANETPTYNAANKLNVASGAASKCGVGDRIRWKQGAGYLYGVLIVIADTLLTIATNTDFVVANSAITDFYYFHQASPIGYPQWFNATVPTFDVTVYDNGSGGQPATVDYRFKITGRELKARFTGSGTKAGASNLIRWTNNLPANVNTSRSAVGYAHINSGTNMGGVVISIGVDDFYIINSDVIADNTGLSNVAVSFSYEI